MCIIVNHHFSPVALGSLGAGIVFLVVIAIPTIITMVILAKVVTKSKINTNSGQHRVIHVQEDQ